MKQKGFTLIELLIAMALGAIIIVGITNGIFQVYRGTIRTRGQVVPLTDVNQAIRWLRKDILMTQSTDLVYVTPQSPPVTLEWTDYTTWATEETRDHYVTYTLSGTDLMRNYDGNEHIIGRNITGIEFILSQDANGGDTINCVITATSPGTTGNTETIEFGVHGYMRSEETA